MWIRTAVIPLILSILLSLMCFPVEAKTESRKKRLALTFDDGPHPVYTDKILDILDKYGVKATFFVIGENAEQWPELINEEIKRGHEIGNHTYSHKNEHKSDKKVLLKDVTITNNILCGYFGYETKLFRPPEGICTDAVREVAFELGYSIVLWDIDTRDWANTPAEKIVKTVLNEANDGSIILFHDYIVGNAHTCDALEIIIPELLKNGYEFVTVSEISA